MEQFLVWRLMKKIFGRARWAEEEEVRRKEEREEELYEKEEMRWDREDRLRHEEEMRRQKRTEPSSLFRDGAQQSRRRKLRKLFLHKLGESDSIAKQARSKDISVRERLDLYKRALSRYISLLREEKTTFKGAVETLEAKVLMQKVQSCMNEAEGLKGKIVHSAAVGSTSVTVDDSAYRVGIRGHYLYFNGSSRRWCWLDNIACQRPVNIDGIHWPSTEHYFQAQKFDDIALRSAIRNTKDPLEAKRLGHSGPLRERWDEMKVQIMLKAIRSKFEQHADLRTKLVDTSPYQIVEHCGDRCWGDGGDGKGKNLLGKILTRVRDEIVERSSSARNRSISVLQQAVAADRIGDLDRALAFYKRGIESYLECAKGLPNETRTAALTMLSKCVSRAELLDKTQERRNSMTSEPSAPPLESDIPDIPVAQIITTRSSLIPMPTVTVETVEVVDPKKTSRF